MTLKFKHFDTRLNQWIHVDGNLNNPDSILTEELDNTLLETYFPNQEFSFGHIDEKSQPSDLDNHPDGQVLLLSSKSRLLYGAPECLETIEKLCPDRKDRGAYGSIFLGSCSQTISQELSILVVDDDNGSNGGILPDETAWRLVGDCHGKISPALAKQLSDSSNHVIQHRLAIPEQYRFAKGTLAPQDLSQLPFSQPNLNIDLIIPTSSFKGGDKDFNPITPGLHKVKIWLGEKERSQRGLIATSQVHASFPEGIKDFLAELEEQADLLREIQSDPRKLAIRYCEKSEKRQAFKSHQSEEESTGESESNDSNDQLMYRLIKADLEGDGQLLETQKVVNELKRFLANEWKDIAIGKTITFDRGMIILSKELHNGEIYVPWFGEGEEVLNFRAPLLNSNGMCLSINKRVPEAFDPDGNLFKGVIVVNDEDHQRLIARIEANRANGIDTDEVAPTETESERQGRDYDGDCIGVALAKNYPHLSAETKRRNQAENAYAPAVKEKKASFYREDGTQPPFEEIAIFMGDSISVGVINNHATALEALESEIDILRFMGTLEQKADYVHQVGSHYLKLLTQENNSKKPQPIKQEYRDRITDIASISESPLTPESISHAMLLNRSIYHDMIGEAAYQNQIAVDIFKSNRAPNMDVIKENNRLLHRIPNYIRDKKQSSIYVHQPIEEKGFSPVELMIRQANTLWAESALVARPTEQFRSLFEESYNPTQYNQALLAKAEFDSLYNQAAILNQKRQNEVGPVLKVKTLSGKELEITNLNKFDHPQAFQATTLDIKLIQNNNNQAHHQLIALAPTGEKDERGQPTYKKLGTVCEISRQELGLQAGMETQNAQVQLAAPLTEKQVQLLFKKAYDYAKSFRESIPPEERSAMAAAAWHIGTTPDGGKNPDYHRISNFPFAAFPDEIISQLGQLQFTEFLVGGLNQHNQVPDELWRSHQTVNLEVRAGEGTERLWYVQDPIDEKWLKFGTVSPKGAQLPLGTKARGTITGDLIATATLKVPGISQPITFGKMGEFDFAGHQFNGEKVKVTIKTYQPEPKPILKLNGKEIGELDTGSVAILGERIQEGTTLKVTLNTLGRNEGTYTLATTSEGETIRANRQVFVGGYKDTRFNGEKATVEVGVKQASTSMAVLLDVDGEQKRAGIFTPNHKSSKEALMKAGLFRDGASFEATISSNITVAKISLEPSSVEYPKQGEWQSTNRIVPQPTAITATADDLLFKLKQQPNLLHRLERSWELPNGEIREYPTLQLAVDVQVAQKATEWLTQNRVPHVFLNPNDPALEPEKQRGYIVLAMVEADVPQATTQQLIGRCGEILDADISSLDKLSEYNQRLELIKPQKKRKLSELQEKYSSFYPDEPLHLPMRSLPTLISIENYEWLQSDGSFSEPIPTWRLSVEPSKLETVEDWLKDNGIVFERATAAKDLEAEGQLGYALIRLIESSAVQAALTEKFGQPLDATGLNGNYYQRLNDIKQGVSQLPQQAPNPPISGKPVSMVFPLKLHGEPNPLPVSTTIEAMRVYGRTHTTRHFEPYKAYGFKEGDIALAVGGDKQVAFRVGKQYRVTTEMLDNPQYRAQWASREKHSPKELDNFRGQSEVWGLEIEPLGDYLNGQIVPFPSSQLNPQVASSPQPLIPSPSQVSSLQPLISSPSKTNPLADLKPLNSAVAQPMKKDIAMAQVATQFIGISAAPPHTPSSTRNYQQAWGEDANTGSYSHDDTIMVSGSGQERGVTSEQIQATFEQHYKPLLDKALAAQANFVVGNAQGTDRLVQEYLKNHGYQLTENSQGYWQSSTPALTHTSPESAKPFREPWEAAMLRAAFSSLETHCSPKDEISTASFANGRYRGIYHPPTDTLYITDERQNRGTLYQAKRGEPATINEFSSLEKQRFLLSERETIPRNHLQIQAHQKSLELDG